MLLRRVGWAFSSRRPATVPAILAACAVALIFISTGPAASEPLPGDALPPSMLGECDGRASLRGGYDKPVAVAAETLVRIGAFTSDHFDDVKIGFCALRDAGGPAATTSCADDIILLDTGYTKKNQDLALVLTLAHEMKHVRQHREKRLAAGLAYCSSDRYETDKHAMEIEADKFGDAIATLLIFGPDKKEVRQ